MANAGDRVSIRDSAGRGLLAGEITKVVAPGPTSRAAVVSVKLDEASLGPEYPPGAEVITFLFEDELEGGGHR